eukprot:scaffold7958_cov25-Tisochrysis_lutea.AAC.2
MPRVPYESVKALRSRTGQSLVRCKEALEASGGDLDGAECWLAGVPANELAPPSQAQQQKQSLSGFTPPGSERGSEADGSVLDSFMQFATPPTGFGSPPSGMEGGGVADMFAGLSTASPAPTPNTLGGGLFAGLSMGLSPLAPEVYETVQTNEAPGGGLGDDLIAATTSVRASSASDATQARIAAAAAAEAAPAAAEAAEARRALETAKYEAAALEERKELLAAEASRAATALLEAQRVESEAEAALAAAEVALSQARHQRGVRAKQAEDAAEASALAVEACSRSNADVFELTAREAEAAAVAERVQREAEARLRAEEEDAQRRAQAEELRRKAEELRRQADALNPHSAANDRSRAAVSASSSMSSLTSCVGMGGTPAPAVDPFGLATWRHSDASSAGSAPRTNGCSTSEDAFGLSLSADGAGATSKAVANGWGPDRGAGTPSSVNGSHGVGADLEQLVLSLKLEAASAERLLSTLAENEVDTVAALKLLTESDYRELGISIGMRRKLSHALGGGSTPVSPVHEPAACVSVIPMACDANALGGVASGVALGSAPPTPAKSVAMRPPADAQRTGIGLGDHALASAASGIDPEHAGGGTPPWLRSAAATLDPPSTSPAIPELAPPGPSLSPPLHPPAVGVGSVAPPTNVGPQGAPHALSVGTVAIYRGQPVTVEAVQNDDPAGPYYAVRLADGSVRDVDGSLEEATPESLQRAMDQMQAELHKLQGAVGARAGLPHSMLGLGEARAGLDESRAHVAHSDPTAMAWVELGRSSIVASGFGSSDQPALQETGDLSPKVRNEGSHDGLLMGDGSAPSAFSFLSTPAVPTGVTAGALSANMFGGEQISSSSEVSQGDSLASALTPMPDPAITVFTEPTPDAGGGSAFSFMGS